MHPSYRELDRLVLSGDPLPPHVTECARCAAHLTAVRPAQGVPGWALERAKRRRLPAWLPLAAAAALTVGVIVAVLPTSEPGYVGAKGAPAVAVYVKRAERTFLWDGSAALRPGDKLRVKVAPEGFSQLTVASDGAILWAGPAPADGLVPTSWELDGDGGAEELIVILSARPVSPDDLDDPPEPAWRTKLVLTKDAP